MGFWLLLNANNALDGTLNPYKPAIFREWQAGAWARGTWGMNDEFAPAGGGGGGGGGGTLATVLKHRRQVKAVAWLNGLR